VLVREPATVRPPGPAEVVVRVAGVALGVEPEAEIAGEVVATGDAAADWVGRRVVVPRVLPCGDCDACRRGRAASCPARAARHGLATHETVPARALVSVEPPLWPAEEPLWCLAALADAAAAPYGALVRAGVGPGELLVVIGAAARGRFAQAIARAKGSQVLVLDGDAARRDRALAEGARFVLDDTLPPEATRAEIERLAREAGLPTSGVKILETSGSAAGRHRAVAMLGDGGVAALLDASHQSGGSAPPLPPTDWGELARREAQVLGAAACHPDLVPELCALVVRGELPLGAIATAVTVEEAGPALAARRAGRGPDLPILRLA
jgi:6-hydroxycyclohex-1-ene-1-carbonyl-CoA dehydrogenase